MTQADLKHRLAAILAADAAGYSRLMAADEQATVAALEAARRSFRAHIEQRQGRVIDMAGDSVLAVFESAAGAVTAALEVQSELDAVSASQPEDRRMRFRIGVHLGDVMEKADGSVFGDGVNIAARLQAAAPAGGVWVSDAVRGAVKARVSASFEDQGEQQMKNLAESVRAYRVSSTTGPTAATSPTSKPASISTEIDLSLPDKPSIAVLPFANMSGDPEQDFFSDGMSEDIITGLSRSPWLFVISRSSSFTYRGLAVDVKKVCRELGVRYVLEGSVRKVGNRVRVTAQLIDGLAANHVFAETYDGHLDDIFALQDDITRKVIAATTTQILSTMDSPLERLKRPDVSTWELVMHGNKLFYELTKESLKRGEAVFRRAVASGPTSCEAHRGLAGILIHQIMMGVPDGTRGDISEAYDLAKRALALEEGNEYAHWTAGTIELWRRNHDLAVAQFTRAIELNPNCSLAYGSLGTTFAYMGKADEAIRNSEIAIRINPKDPSIFFRFSAIALANYLACRYEDAATWAQRTVQRKPNWFLGHCILVASLAKLNRATETKGALDSLLQEIPGAAISIVDKLPLKYVEHAESLKHGLRKAGLPD